jgi:hypothetical protein
MNNTVGLGLRERFRSKSLEEGAMTIIADISGAALAGAVLDASKTATKWGVQAIRRGARAIERAARKRTQRKAKRSAKRQARK